MSSTITFSGLSTGLDTGKIVDQLVAAEKVPATALATRKTEATKRISIIGDLVTKLSALKSSAAAFADGTSVRSLTALSSDDTRVTASAVSTAKPGLYSVRVDQLAQAETTRSRTFATNVAGAAGSGLLSIQVGSGAAIDVAFDGNDSLDDIATRINESGAKVNAGVLFDGTNYRLTVTSAESGTASALAFGGTGDLLGLDDPANEIVTAKDAKVNVNGSDLVRSSNSLADVIPGVTFELRSLTPAGSAATQVRVSQDAAGTRAKMQTLVDSYNAIAKAVSAQTTYSGSQRGQDTLFGDPTVQGLQRDLAGIISKFYPHGAGTIATSQLGLSLGRDGQLTLDATKFDTAVGKDPQALVSLLAGANKDGLAAAMTSMVDRYTKSGTGILVSKQSSLSSLTASYDKEIDRINEAAESLGARLRKQFVALEQTMSKLNSQTSYIDKIFSTKSDS